MNPCRSWCAGQSIKMLSIYLVMKMGWRCCGRDFRNFLMTTDVKMFAIVGEKAAPMAIPWICWKTNWVHWK